MSRLARIVAACALLAPLGVGLGVAGACTNAELYVPDAGEFRGITIPLPPPSFTDADEVTIDVSGNINHEPAPGTVVALWESEAGEGRLVPPEDDGSFLFESVVVVPDQSCLELWSEYPEDGDIIRSSEASYKVIVVTDDPECGSQDLCSAPDDDGNCLCLDPRYDNC